jgi:hypothetical protein
MDEILQYLNAPELRSKPYLYLQNHPIYGGRLRMVLHAMNAWRRYIFKHLMIKPYNGPLSYYAFWFAVKFWREKYTRNHRNCM